MSERYPKRFGKYILLKPLARGGMGQIYVAASGEIDGFEKLCVIKKVLTEKADRGKANRFLDEAKVVLRLSHGNLVLTFDAGEVDGEFFIAMELVEGKDLREIWNRCVRTRTRIPLDVALHIVRELARALSYVHNYGDLNLVHRDVAPPNILLSYFGQVKLTDFGLARSVLKQEHTNPGVVFGRASYLAPEQARGEVADARSDIYSLGIVLWELLTGQQYMQLSDLDPATALSLVRHPRPQPPSTKAPWIGPELDEIVMCALSPEREGRFQSAEELREALSEVIIRVAPHADAERASEFLRGLYGKIIKDERDERERLLSGRLSSSGHPAAADEAEADRDFVGRVIDNRYRILRKIGEGGMGTIYASEHVEIRKGVAIKILHPVYSKQQNLVERFRREARAASRIGHPNIIDVTDFGTTEDGCAYFVMEHLEGIDLADVLSHERKIEPLRAVRIGMQICSALHAAHAAGVIHRDLKPENIFLVARDGEADFVKVLDFGIARSLSRRSRRLTNPGMAMGTPEYMAPEQAMATGGGDGGGVDRRSDIYSVGALLYEMISGAPPHAGVTYQDILAQRARALPEPLRTSEPDLPEELDQAILRALEPEPRMRFQTMAQLQYELTKIVWGRARAVSELLNMREPNARMETPIGLRTRRSDSSMSIERPIFDDVAAASGQGRKKTPEAVPGVVPAYRTDRTSRPSYGAVGDLPAILPSNDAPASRLGLLAQFGARTVGTLAILSVAIVLSVGAYQRFPWVRGAPTRPAPAAAGPRAAAPPVQPAGPVVTAAMAPPLPEPVLRERRMRAQVLRRRADAALDRGEVQNGVTLLQAALALDPGAPGNGLVAHALLDRGRKALAAQHPAEAVAWGRRALGFAGADPGAHGFLADALYAAHEFAGSASEYVKALSSRPGDPALQRGLQRARARLAGSPPEPVDDGDHRVRPAAGAPRPRSRDARPMRARSSEATPAASPSSSRPPPSAAGEPAAEQE
jgi:serine/threonine protein kinase